MLENYQATNAAFTALRVDGSCVAWGHPQSGGVLGQELLEVHGLDGGQCLLMKNSQTSE